MIMITFIIRRCRGLAAFWCALPVRGDPEGSTIALKAFAAHHHGRIWRCRGCDHGGLALGIIEDLRRGLYLVQYKDGFAFGAGRLLVFRARHLRRNASAEKALSAPSENLAVAATRPARKAACGLRHLPYS